jgi:dTDP-4-dehydrorhamnose reductase
MKKILLLGAQGMLGAEIFHESLKENNLEIIPFSRFNLDITNKNKVLDTIKNLDIDLIINSAAFTMVDKCEEEKHKEISNIVNNLSLEYLVEVCRDKKIPIYHFSTDYVFNGENNKVFCEKDKTCPINEYGRQKDAGEKIILNYDKGFVLRTSWLVGEYGPNFVSKIVHILKNNRNLSIIKNEYGSPSFCLDVAKSLLNLLNKEEPKEKIFHMVNDGFVSRIEFVKEIQNYLGIKTEINPVKSIDLLAKRPISSALKNTYLPSLGSWKEGLYKFLEDEKRKIEEKRIIEDKKRKGQEKARKIALEEKKLKEENAKK